MNKIILYGLLTIVLLGAGVAMYFIFFNKPALGVAQPSSSDAVSLPTADASAQVTPETQPSAAVPATATSVTARLVKISDGPVVPGEVLVDGAGSASSSPEVTLSYLERESGNVYSYLFHARTLTRVNNKTIPGIQSATWLPDGSFAFVRYLSGTDFSTVNTYALPASGSNGFFLPQNIADIAVSSTSVLALASGVNGSVASVSRPDGSQSSEVFSTPLSSLRVSFAGKNQYLAYTKPSSTLSGAAFLVDKNGMTRVAGPLTGLVAKASPSGKWLLVSYSNNGVLQMNLVNVAIGESLPLPIATIADKCVWTNDDATIYCGIPVSPPSNANYPDDWYQGAISFSDRIWKIQVLGRYAQLVLDFSKESGGGLLDAEALAVDPLLSTLVFVNKNDGSLWSYSL